MTEPLWSAILQRIAPAFSQRQVQPLVVLDAYDLETLVGLCEGGASMHQVLGRKAHGAYQALDFSRFVSDDPRLEPVRARSVRARGDRLFDDFAARAGLDVGELGKLREDARERGELL